MTFDDPHRVQRIVEELTGGDPQGAAEMLSLAYEELRSMAAGILHRGGRHQTLQPTALVHELYLRLTGHADGAWHDRCHFLAVASMAMRQIVMDHARQRRAEKRGGGWDRVTLSDVVGASPLAEADLIALDSALTKLDQLNERQARIVELRFLAGLTVEEVATLLDVSETTVKRDWRMARAWLMNELSDGE